MFGKANHLNMRSFDTWKVTRRDKSQIELTVSFFFLFYFVLKENQVNKIMTVTPHSSSSSSASFFLVLNDQRMISPCEATGVILTNSCRLIFEWTKITRKMKWYIISIIIQTILHRFIYFCTFTRLFFSRSGAIYLFANVID